MRTPGHPSPLWRRGLAVLSMSAVLLFAHAFVPMEEFVHRGDDAFYYFKVAIDFPQNGRWSFDGVHGTNGVQPLWAILLSALAYPLHWLSVSDPVAARVYVGVTAAFHLASGLLLFRLLSRTVSIGTGLAAAGGLLFPMAITWSRVWGMENAFYTTLLVCAVSYHHLEFLGRQGARTALNLGLLLGLTVLSRLNSGLLVVFLLASYLAKGPRADLGRRLRLGAVVCAGAALLVVPYAAWNLAQTGHLLPVSGAVKSLQASQWMASQGVDSRVSPEFVSAVYERWRKPLEWSIASRALDGLWALGVRIPFQDTGRAGSVEGGLSKRFVLLAVAVLLTSPLLLGRVREWGLFLAKRAGRLGRFWYVAAFGACNAALSIWLYPSELYSILRWWLAECEVVVIVATAALVAAFASYSGRRLLAAKARTRLATAVTLVLAVYHCGETIACYFDGKRQTWDWNQSWNDHMYEAARWIDANLPPDAVVGSWNAGVLGFYSNRCVVNLDGLVNDYDLLPYIESRNVDAYIRRERIGYLADYQPEFDAEGVLPKLVVRPVHTSVTDWGTPYRVYEVVR